LRFAGAKVRRKIKNEKLRMKNYRLFSVY